MLEYEGVFMDIRIEALLATAKAYYDRGKYLQYDDTRLVAGDVVEPPVYRWQRHINSPEDCTRQHTGYTNCAAYCYDIYKQALDLDIITWCTEMMTAAGDMLAFRYEVRGDETEEEKKMLEKVYRDALRPGDIIVSRHDPKYVGGGGHAMFYIGDNKILHSSAPGGGNYDYNARVDKVEPDGSIAYMSVDELFDVNSARRYFFRELNFAIVRPLIKYKDATVTENAKNRLNNMKDIFAEKLCSHVTGQTASIGENITFTYYIRNNRDTDVQIFVEDTVPENTEYVSGGENADGNSVGWHISLGAGESARFGYTVKVKDTVKTGDHIQSIGKVGGVDIRCPKVYIADHPCDDEEEAIYKACKKLDGEECAFSELPKKVYDAAGLELFAQDPTEVLKCSFRSHKGTDTHFELDLNSKYFPMVVPTMYGGRYVATSAAFCKVRTSGAFAHELFAGDVIIASDDAQCTQITVFIYGGEGICLTVCDGKIKLLTGEDCDKALMSIVSYYKFVVLRPIKK